MIILISQESSYYGRDLGIKQGLETLLERLAAIDALRFFAPPNTDTKTRPSWRSGETETPYGPFASSDPKRSVRVTGIVGELQRHAKVRRLSVQAVQLAFQAQGTPTASVDP